jgi:hypothetical protein
VKVDKRTLDGGGRWIDFSVNDLMIVLNFEHGICRLGIKGNNILMSCHDDWRDSQWGLNVALNKGAVYQSTYLVSRHWIEAKEALNHTCKVTTHHEQLARASRRVIWHKCVYEINDAMWRCLQSITLSEHGVLQPGSKECWYTNYVYVSTDYNPPREHPKSMNSSLNCRFCSRSQY